MVAAVSVLGGDLGRVLPELRAEAESLMVTECVLERKDGFTVNPENGQRVDRWVPVWVPAVGGPGCKVVTSREHREIVVGGQRVTTKPTTVCVPWDAPKARQGDRFVTPRGVFWVAGVEHHSWNIQQRYTCTENQEVAGL